jgi:DNA-binding NarL/FixJ family response regulator
MEQVLCPIRAYSFASIQPAIWGRRVLQTAIKETTYEHRILYSAADDRGSGARGASPVNPNLRINVFLLVGNHLLRKSLGRIIQQRPDIFVIGQSADLSNIAPIIARSEGDVILLDSVSATALSRQCVTRIRDLNPNAQILMIGMDADEGAFLTAVRAGVSGYLVHEATAANVVAAIRAVARGEAVCPSGFCKALFDALARVGEFTPSVRKMGLRLTRRQQELFPMVARGLTNKEIASLLNLSEHTVKNHIHRMLRKIGANHRSQVLEIARAEHLPN